MIVKIVTAVALAASGVAFAGAPATATATATISVAPISCTIQRLTEPPGSQLSIVTGADPTGRFIVGRGYPAGDARTTVIWEGNRAPIRVKLPGIDQLLADISTSGVAVGTSFDAATFQAMTPWVYRNGAGGWKVAALRGVASGDAVGINERGQIAGNRHTADGSRPVRWASAQSAAVNLRLPADALSGNALDIDTDGTVIGYYTNTDGDDRAIVWHPDGSFDLLPAPAGYGPLTRAFQGRNGWVVGLTGGGGELVSARWHRPTNQARVFPEFDIAASGVNRRGWQVGSSLKGKALFVSDTEVTELPGLAYHGEPLGDIATTITDDARVIAGQALDANGAIRAVRWQC